ncbi:hypothetical protein BX616_006931 [Lobosporangium transversale]|uniref:F-box domain-containing protein n=1 Tax=Lobosporangium transversale TaxID=64571 RepID=A0A1Y2GVP4_9FUNG|nr:hypothetical protein BCR41DRAFT_349189 [Lobosporangium transversale]KAF9915084.1 hypothetical protein BX616_006931 [Lobosporangium transversale]ORZ23792.1 hypothetical protein BCR41DRAFT_349189 [Lobosporangium transversale]|eukprot:XP_021883606.1 hypothetical protein BCR41DRAFT_349189 [Lobosporangium transversale]
MEHGRKGNSTVLLPVSTMLRSSKSYLRIKSSSGFSEPASTNKLSLGSHQQFPPEIWTCIIQYLSTLDLFNFYNTSTTLRSIVAPFLIQAIASNSVCLYFYQEYVCRTGISFIFDHFDLAHDKVVFRPQAPASSAVIAFRIGMTIQRPQLEEISVKSRGTRFQSWQAYCSNDGIYKVRRKDDKRRPVLLDRTTGTVIGDSNDDQSRITTISSKAVARRLGPTLRFLDNRLASLDYLDRVCPLDVKRTGPRLLSGAQHSFGHDYPWTLHYTVDDKPDYRSDDYIARSTVTTTTIATSTAIAALPALPQHITQRYGGPQSSRRDSSINGDSNNNSSMKSASKGPRYLHAVRFECSINFLDPRRASRSLFRRWLEGKMSQVLQVVKVRDSTSVLVRKLGHHHRTCTHSTRGIL